MNIPTIPKGPELGELLDADPEYAKRYEQCLRDIEVCESFVELERRTSVANLGRGYGQERNSHRGMLHRAAKYNIPLSDELRDFAAFLVHLGPKPHYETTGALSLDKTNSKGYIVGHIRWLGPEGQTRNRSCSKFHRYKGRYYNDKELATLLSTLSGKPITADAVKKRRNRGKTTVEQFAMAGVPYESGLDPVSEWDFPPAYVTTMTALHRVFHYKGESRIAFFIRRLRTTEIPRFETHMLNLAATAEQRDDLRRLAGEFRSALSHAELTLRELQRKNISKEIANSVYQPFSPAGVETTHSKLTDLGNDKLASSVLPARAVPAAADTANIVSSAPAPSETGNAHAGADGLNPVTVPSGQDEASLLDPVVHALLLADMARVCWVANVLPAFVHRSAKPFLTEQEFEWVRKFREHAAAGRGLVLTGQHPVPPDFKCQAIAGVFIRNHTDARVIPLHMLLSLFRDGELPNPRVLLVPNLFIVSETKALPEWRLLELHDLLIQRRCAGKVTVAYVEDLAKMDQGIWRSIACLLTSGIEAPSVVT